MKRKSKTGESNQDHVLVYSTDPIPEKNCMGCLRAISQCVCKKNVHVSLKDVKPSVNIERAGRAGKTVTIIGKLPAHETFLKELLTSLKKSLGCGGTFYIEDGKGVIEIQGERREQVLRLLSAYN